jgi:hypothetical protein
MRLPLLIASAMALAACAAPDSPTTGNGHAGAGSAANASTAQSAATAPRERLAGLPDKGQLLGYASAAGQTRGAYTFHEVALSEEHALRAITDGTLELQAPDGTPIRLRYANHVEHANGDWTWVGRPEGAKPGTEAIITFGDTAVFGTIPNGRKQPLRITSVQGRTYLMETDGAKVARLRSVGNRPTAPDYAVPPALAGARDKALAMAAATPQKLTASGAVPESATVDVAIGYTNTFASRLGGTAAALTRLNHLVDVANQAFTNSQIVARLRLVRTVALNYPDATSNETALRELSGLSCTESGGSLDCVEAPVPAALQPLVTARAASRADLMSLVRNFSDPENESCGIAWMLGSGQTNITAADAYAAVSVVSDSSYDLYPDNGYICRNETFVHELGHNMGSAHDVVTARGDDGTLTADEYGRYAYSFGYKTDAGSFYTIMAYGDSGQTPYRVFSNPRITYCGSQACGTADADNARSLGQTAPVIAAFYASIATRRWDFDGDGFADLLWRNTSTGANQAWRSANNNTRITMATVTGNAWQIFGTGDFNKDGRADLVWRNVSTGANTIWLSGSNATQQAVVALADLNWKIVGVGDFDGDGFSDLVWRNSANGMNRIWRSANNAAQLTPATVADQNWVIAGIGDFDGDGRSDFLWRNTTTGENKIWRSANNSAPIAVALVNNMAWKVVGVADFDGDGRADILWRNSSTGGNLVWRSGSNATQTTLTTVGSQAWQVAAVADYDGDGRADILWRNASTGANQIWRAGNAATQQAVAMVNSAGWTVIKG